MTDTIFAAIASGAAAWSSGVVLWAFSADRLSRTLAIDGLSLSMESLVGLKRDEEPKPVRRPPSSKVRNLQRTKVRPKVPARG